MTIVINGKTFYLRPDASGHIGLYTKGHARHGTTWHEAKLSDIPVTLHATVVDSAQ